MKIQNFAVLQGGKTVIKDGNIRYLPEFETGEDGKQGEPISADIRADKIFYQGTFQFKFKAKSDDVGVILIVEDEGNHISTIGYSKQAKAFVITDIVNKSRVKAGNIKNYEKNKEIALKLDWTGSRCKLFVNQVLMCEVNNFARTMMPIHMRITSDAEVNVFDVEMNSVNPKLFVVMQFTEDFNKLYDEVILPIAQEHGFDCVRADDFYTSTPILTDIIASIEESIAIIAEITPDNPNVFYEIGYAHAIKKTTILLCDKKRDKLPFDISGFRTLFYENTIAGKSQIEKSLSKYLKTIR
ncbi:MAG TPA: hypothetical protein VF676_03210 [Flavobacterium sp.]|jgi:hypothetical protein